MQDYFEERQQQISVKLIRNWKNNESKLMAEYGDRASYFLEAMAKELWQDEKIKAEFDYNFETLRAYLENSHRVTAHTSKIKRFTKADAPADDAPSDAGIKNKWNSDPSLQAEFGDYSTYAAYEKNKGKVRVYNR